MERTRVVVVGGGVAGCVMAKGLQDQCDVHLIDPKEYFEIAWAAMRAIVEPSFAERTLINHSEYLSQAHIITSAATNITESEVTTADGRRVGFDYLVIATGHAGGPEFTRSEKLHKYQGEHDKIKAAKSVLVVGGGPSGVELASEIIFAYPDKKVTLVHKGPRLLEFVGEKAGKKALNWLISKKVEVILDQSVDLESGSNGVYHTSGGETIHADCHYLCIGKPLASSWLMETCVRDSLDAHGRLMVDNKFRVKGHNNIFAIGDITDVPELKQGYLAQGHAAVVAKNVKLLMKGQSESKLATYKPASAFALVSLGKKEGVAQMMCLTLSGRIPGMIKSGDLFVGASRKNLGLKSN
ncbi:hypothetical protein SASPL_108361 [Salvia splendens]|uniref:FAD/NAD(P)-binding domain-containing protein n=1 Tax=Salvia splendens TaxID=180675 RepID=A0A8X8YGK1_SALSN|nr:apoptosis-inducing factor homolog B-like [Salvia splendens]KAG6430297.1 hypothetical protein SASPL_108361 [Salvia splendens]